MMTNCKLLLVLIFTIALWSCSGIQNKTVPTEINPNNNYKDSLSTALALELKKETLPGFAVSVFSKDSIYFIGGYGFSDVENKKLYTENTIQGIASISKTLIAVSLMKAVENRTLTLDDEINSILPFQVTNPNYRDTPITLRQLATHTSSISDEGNYHRAYLFSEHLEHEQFPEAWSDHITRYNTNDTMLMDKFLENVFVGWETEDNFLSEKPGDNYAYSNIGAALLAYCLEIKTKRSYREITEELILQPLSMNSSGWSYDKSIKENYVINYNEIYNIVPNYNVITYPDGGLYSTVADLTKYMQEMLGGCQGEGKLLNQSSYRTMMENQIPELSTATGIIWDLDIECCIGHGGNDFGIATLAYFDPKNGIGKILFTNITIEKEEQEDQFYSIFNTMFKYDSMITSDVVNK